MSGIILIAEDDELLRHAIVAALRAAGFATVEASDGVEALREARAARFDAVLLDRSMNKLDGLSVLKTLREEGLETPIMFLTAAGRLEDRVHGLEAGADDYMAKPFELAELIARARPDPPPGAARTARNYRRRRTPRPHFPPRRSARGGRQANGSGLRYSGGARTPTRTYLYPRNTPHAAWV